MSSFGSYIYQWVSLAQRGLDGCSSGPEVTAHRGGTEDIDVVDQAGIAFVSNDRRDHLNSR
jgi:hypothetical protein